MGANRRTRRAIARGQLRRQPLKRGLLINPKDTWPRFDGGISMEPAGTTPDGLQTFTYTHSAAYQVCVHLCQDTSGSFLILPVNSPPCALCKRDLKQGWFAYSSTTGPHLHQTGIFGLLLWEKAKLSGM